MSEREMSVQADEVCLQFGWYAAQSGGQEHEVVHNMADEIVRLRDERDAYMTIGLQRLNRIEELDAQVEELMSALADCDAGAGVVDGAWAVSRWHVANRVGWLKLDETTRINLPQYSRARAEQLAAWWDRVEPNNAPHRVVRVALLDDAAAAAGREEAEAMRLALDVLTWQLEAQTRCGDPDAECPLQDACKPSHGHTRAIAALRRALAPAPEAGEVGG